MKCKLCSSADIRVEYYGKLKTNLVPPLSQTKDEVNVFICDACGVMWHEYIPPTSFYETEAYRTAIEGNNDIIQYYQRHDKDVIKKLTWTGTDIFRNKTIADIGAGGGSFLDFLLGVADKTIAIEPNQEYREGMIKKGHEVFAYTKDALLRITNNAHGGVVDIITSFDVIEHVNDPQTWLNELYRLLKQNGQIILGTPTSYPILRKLIGVEFDNFLFQVVHPWIFSEQSLRILFEKSGFQDIHIEQKYHFGIGNVINWLTTRTAKGDVQYSEFSDTLNEVWRSEMVNKGFGEYLLVYARK